MIIKTTEDNNHYHLVIVDKQGRLTVVEKDDHGHDVEMDALSGQPSIAESDNHTHTLSPEPIAKKKKKKRNDSEQVEHVKDRYKKAKDLEEGSISRARKAKIFVHSDSQWSDNDKKFLEASGRSAETIDLVSGALNILYGHKRKSSTDISIAPVGSEDELVSYVLTEIIRHIAKENDLPSVELDIFADEVECGRGLWHLYIDYSDIEGNIIVERFNYDDVVFGSHNNRNCKDLPYLVKTKWHTKDYVESHWPDKADDIKEDFKRYDDAIVKYTPDYDFSEQADPDLVNIKLKKYRVMELEEKMYNRVPVVINSSIGLIQNAENWSKEDLKSMEDYGARVVYAIKNFIKKTMVAGDVLLSMSEVEDEGDYSVIPVYAKKNKDEFYGVMKPVVGPQNMVNATFSQALNIISKSVYGWSYDNQTFENQAEERKFREQGAKAGFMVKLRPGKRLEKYEGTRIPAEVITMLDKARAAVFDTLNIRPEFIPSDRTSGEALRETEEQALTGNEYLFAHMEEAKKLIGKKLVKLIVKTYNSPQRLKRLLKNLNEQQIQEVLETFKKEDLCIDIAIVPSPHSVTQQRKDFVMLASMAEKGHAIPPELLIKVSPLAPEHKEAAMRALQQQQQQQQAEAQQKSQTEINKTLIANQPRPGGA